MASSSFHHDPYDAGTLLKLKIFELYVQEWIPVFVSRPEPPFTQLHVFDLFSGPGTDSIGTPGSPLRILKQLLDYQARGMAGWSKVRVAAHFSDAHQAKAAHLGALVQRPEWHIPDVSVEVQCELFQDALERHRMVLRDPRAAKLVIIDQFGVDAVTDEVFKQLIAFPRTDFIFFLSSSTLHRFRNHAAIKIKIEKPEDSYDVHRAAFDWFRNLAPKDVYLGRFSIRKRSNIYGLIFGSQHPLGIHKFLQVAWRNDEISGEANFDIDRENRTADELLLPLEELRPKKIQAFEADLEAALKSGAMKTEADVVRFCISAGMTCQHARSVIQKLQAQGAISCSFTVPDVGRIRNPRSIAVSE